MTERIRLIRMLSKRDKLLREVRDAWRRMDPAWCATHGQEQISDEDLDKTIATLEDLLEDHDAHGVEP